MNDCLCLLFEREFDVSDSPIYTLGRMSAGMLMGYDSPGRMSADVLMGHDSLGRMSAGILMGYDSLGRMSAGASHIEFT